MKKILFFFAALFFIACSDEKVYKIEVKESVKKELIFGVHPYLNPKEMEKVYSPLISYLSQNIDGVEFKLEASKDYAHFEEKLYAGKFDFALPNPYQTIKSLSHNHKVIAKMVPDSDFRGVIVARRDKNIKSISQLKNQTMSFPAPTALAATMMPLYFLHSNGIDVNKELNKKFVGSQFSSIMNAYTGDTVAAATWPPPWRAWSEQNPERAKEMELIWQTEPLPNNGVVANRRVDEKIIDKFQELIVKFRDEEIGKSTLKDGKFDGFERANDKRYNIVNEFLKEYDEKIGLPK